MAKTYIHPLMPVNPQQSNTNNSILNAKKQSEQDFSKFLKTAEATKSTKTEAANKSNSLNNGTNFAAKQVDEHLMEVTKGFVQQFMTFYAELICDASETNKDKNREVKLWQSKLVEAMITGDQKNSNSISSKFTKEIYNQLEKQALKNEK